MSIEVGLTELGTALQDYPWGYLVTVGDDGRGRSLAVPTQFVDGRLHCAAGERTRAAVAARHQVTMVFPPGVGTGYSLIVDGDAEISGTTVVVQPTWAVLHRPALTD
jgi:hypothetical protein